MLCHSWRNTLPAARWHRSSAVVMNQHEPTRLDVLAEGWLICAIDLPVFYQATGEGNWKGQLHFRCACTCNPLRVVNSSMDSAFVCQVLVVQDWKTTARQRCASVFAVGNPSMSRYITNSSNVVHRTLINLQLGMVHSTHVWQIAGWFGMIKNVYVHEPLQIMPTEKFGHDKHVGWTPTMWRLKSNLQLRCFPVLTSYVHWSTSTSFLSKRGWGWGRHFHMATMATGNHCHIYKKAQPTWWNPEVAGRCRLGEFLPSPPFKWRRHA